MTTHTPRWLIDDTADITDARVFVAHTQTPRFVGELIPEHESRLEGLELVAPQNQVVSRIQWIDPPEFDATELTASLAAAVDHHYGVRGR